MALFTKITLGTMSALMGSQAITALPTMSEANSLNQQTKTYEISGEHDSFDLDEYKSFIESSNLPENIKIMLTDAIENNLTAEQLKAKYINVLSASDLELLNEIIEEPSERGVAGIVLKIVLKFVKKYGIKAACAYFSIQGAHYWLYNACKAAGWW